MLDQQFSDKRLRTAAILLNAIGILIIILTVAFSLHFGIGMLSGLFGLIAFPLSRSIRSSLLTAMSFFVTIGFALLFFVAWWTEPLWHKPVYTQSEVVITAPRHTYTLTGNIDEMIKVSNEWGGKRVRYFYIGADDCMDCDTCVEFNTALKNVMDELEAYSYTIDENDEDYYYLDHSYIYYYDTKKMPPEEVDDVIKRFEIKSQPCLVKVNHSAVIDKAADADEARIKQFFIAS